MTNCIIVHGCPNNEKDKTYNKHWLPWARKELEMKGIETQMPLMPHPWKADYNIWKEKFDKLNIDEKTILIGHSCGAAFLVRWLGDSEKKIAKLILVAPWKVLYGDYLKREDKINFYGFNIKKEIRNNVGQVVIFTSDNEEKEGKESAKLFHKVLGGKLIELKGKGHYTNRYMGTDEFPELVEEVLGD